MATPANTPPVRPSVVRPQVPRRVGAVASAVPPLYANSFEIEQGDYDFSIRFQQRDPYLDRLRDRAEAGEGPSELDVATQLPSVIVALSPLAAAALWEALGEKLGKGG